MPPNTATLRVGPYLLSLLLIFVVLFGLVFLPGQRRTPKLGLDLEGGAQVTLQAQTPNGKTPNQSAMKVAQQILENRVNAKGVSAARVYQQGKNQIVIAVPGANSQDVARVGQAAKLNFRSVLFAAVPNTAATTATPTSSASGSAAAPSSGSAATTGATTAGATTPAGATNAPASTGTTAPKATTSPNGLLDAKRLAVGTTPATTTAAKTTAARTTAAKATAAKTTAAAPTTAASAAKTTLSPNPFAKLGFALPKTNAAYDALTATQQAALQAALANFDCNAKPADVADQPLAACDVPVGKAAPTAKYLLSEVIVAGTEISSADAVAPDSQSPSWSVSINLKSKGQTAWANFTGAHHSMTDNPGGATSCSATTVPCADYVAFTLDGAVVTAPQTNSTINGTTQVTGNFQESYAKDLANDLKYGALPLNFTQLNQAEVSATLGSSQLKAGLLAGGIGLLLVVIYSFLYYRGLGFVTVLSLVVSGGLTYAMLVILGREIGFTLTLAGIAGFIVAVGITADSFVVFFERLKDEVHSGRSLRVAVPRAWTRARRTILSADTVSFIAAAVLYYFTVGDVRGFAFTLGLSTILDLVVVFLFTHPLVSLLSRSKAFGSPRFTGLDSVRAGGIASSPEAPARTAKARRARAGGATVIGGGSVALLEREDDLDLDDDLVADDDGLTDVDDDVATPVASAPAVTREPELDSGAPRRSRVVPRSAPAAEISADAAERAAARRGRTVRPPKPVITEPDEDADDDQLEDVDALEDATDDDLEATSEAPDATEVAEPEPDAVVDTVEPPEPAGRRRRRFGRGATAVSAKTAPTESVDTALDDSEPVTVESEDAAEVTEPVEPVVEALPDPPAVVPSGSAGTAAERAAARRRRPGRGSTAVNAEPVEAAPVDTAPVDTAPVDTAPVDAAPVDTEPVDAAPISAEPVEAAPVVTESVETAPVEAVAPEPAVVAEPLTDDAGPVPDTDPQPGTDDPVAQAATADAPSRPTTAAERAAARRARIRTRATATSDLDGEES